MSQPAPVSRPAWLAALSGSGAARRSPVEIVANAASYVTRTQAAELSGLRAGWLGRWTDGVATLRGDCLSFATHWKAHNDQVLREPGPLWVVLGDSTAQGLGALHPEGGYVGQALAELRLRTGQPWRVLNLSTSGALIRDVLGDQLPRVPGHADLVSCGIGVNDIFYSGPRRLMRDLRSLIAALPPDAVLLDLPLPSRLWGVLGWASLPYVHRINRTIYAEAGVRGLPVAQISAHFQPPWSGKFAADFFHPSQAGYRDWSRALLAALPLSGPAAQPAR